ncbi:DUF6338 family protein [Micromonospora sp. NPDC005413]|uniref:DUF6338 family protein n=1 Tax=Micromonospora sp. NPDC005413 TaxID=3154563 RepID=UPI0033BB5F14
MIPSSLLGLVLFVVLLAPGLAYVLRHERAVPAPSHSTLRETLRVVFVSVACLTFTGLLSAGLRLACPERTPNVRGLIQDPADFAREHHVQLVWWSLALITFATLLGFFSADPRLLAGLRQMRSKAWAQRLLGDAPIKDSSAWHQAMSDLKSRDHAAIGRKKREDETFIGVQMDDGTYVRGYLVSYSPGGVEDDQRELILTRAEIRPVDGEIQPIGSTLTVISARHIVRLDVTHLKKREEAFAAELPASSAPVQREGT